MKKKSSDVKKTGASCENCEFYDWSEEGEQFECRADLDEDELVRFLSFNTAACPYFKFYDEYKSVQKQN